MRKKILNNTPVNKDAYDFSSFAFAKTYIPQPTEDVKADSEVRVRYGDDNLYPDFLLGLYADSPIHSAVINGKATYIIGDGLKGKDGRAIELNVNASDRFEDFVSKCVKDYLIFNAFAVEVCFNNLGQPIEYHWVSVSKLRTNKNKSKFWFKESWSKNGSQEIIYDRYLPNYNQDSKSKIFYFDGYFPSLSSVYPTAEYQASIKSIVTDIAIREFNINNIKNQFSVSSLITFFNGDSVSKEQRSETAKKMKQQFSGEDGGKIMLQWVNEDGKAPEISNLSAGDWDKAYDLIAKKVSDDIFIGHQVTNPMLFGVKTEGQLGGATELETAFEIFKNTYILNKRNELESSFNMLFNKSVDMPKALNFVDKPLFHTQISDTTKEKIFTINELRKEAGLSPLPNGDRLLNEPAPTQSKEPDYTNGRTLSEDDYEAFFSANQELGVLKTDFEIVDENKFSFASRTEYLTMYEYQKRPDVSGSDIISTTRNFCRRLLMSDKYYSREDIQKMSDFFGYDVFEKCGGWYRVPNTNVSEKQCRHEWKQVLLKKK